MTHHHSHSHHDHQVDRHYSPLAIVFWLNFIFSIFEFFGGIWINSVAVQSDALHDFGDSITFGLAYFMEKLSKKPASTHFSYGFQRLSLFSALISAGILISGSVFILTSATEKLLNSDQNLPNLQGMVFFSIVGILVNGTAAYRVYSGRTLNEKILTWHLLEDVLGWTAILFSTSIMYVWPAPMLDPILSILITIIILFGVWRNTQEAFRIFLQGVPKHLNIEKIKNEIKKNNDIIDIHDIHIWSLDGEQHVLTLHVVLKKLLSPEQSTSLKHKIKSELQSHGKIHVTMEIETEEEFCDTKNCNAI